MRSNRALKSLFNISPARVATSMQKQAVEMDAVLMNQITNTLSPINMSMMIQQNDINTNHQWQGGPSRKLESPYFPGSTTKVFGKRELHGFPVAPYQDWTFDNWMNSPRALAKSTPRAGSAEVSTTISQWMPGQRNMGALQFTFATAKLCGHAPLYLSDDGVMNVVTTPIVNGFLACGGSDGTPNRPEDFTGYSLEMGLQVNSLITGKSVHNTFNIAREAGVFQLPFTVNRLDDAQYYLSLPIEVEKRDYLVFSLSLNAVVFHHTNGVGMSMIDLEGLGSSSGSLPNKRPGGLSMNGFNIEPLNRPMSSLFTPVYQNQHEFLN